MSLRMQCRGKATACRILIRTPAPVASLPPSAVGSPTRFPPSDTGTIATSGLASAYR
jgi:hypothetical protein